MKITIGEWRTRDGRKAIVGAINESGKLYSQCVGWVGESVFSWSINGQWIPEANRDLDLIEPWIDPVPWDWSTTPPWINWIAMDGNGFWNMYISNPDCGITAWNTNNYYHRIPPSHAPKWSGDWRKSKTMRPGYKEAK